MHDAGTKGSGAGRSKEEKETPNERVDNVKGDFVRKETEENENTNSYITAPVVHKENK